MTSCVIVTHLVVSALLACWAAHLCAKMGSLLAASASTASLYALSRARCPLEGFSGSLARVPLQHDTCLCWESTLHFSQGTMFAMSSMFQIDTNKHTVHSPAAGSSSDDHHDHTLLG